MGRLVADLTGGDLPLRGVVHAAGISDPQFVRDVTDEVYARVWRPKVVGGWVLHSLTRDLDLDFYLSFSSIASTWGSQHLASYAAANAFLDGLAYHRAKRGARALTTNWGPWETASGLFGDDVMNFLKSVGLRPLRADQCLALLGSLLAGDAPQGVVCAADWRQYKQVMEAKRERPMLRGIEIADEVAGDGKPSAVLDELLGSEPDDQYAIVDHYVREQLSLILQLDIAQLQGEFHLLEVGLDSLMVMELISRCRKDLAIKFESRDFFATDANDWAGWLLDLVRTQHGSVDTPAAA
jgi:acyl carrier protein